MDKNGKELLRYDDIYAVELWDKVTVLVDDHLYEGYVAKLFPRTEQVQVGYLDWMNVNRAGDPSRKSARVSVRDIELVRRDG
ncbi:MAG: hypothetical protein WBN86_10190 [Porticoccaceae bacterium]